MGEGELSLGVCFDRSRFPMTSCARTATLLVCPEWYWKAVCDPVKKQSVFFLRENTITDTEDNQKEVKGCFKIKQHKHSGVINCFSLNDAKTTFKRMFQIPDFHVKNCDPSKIGDDFRVVLQNSLV